MEKAIYIQSCTFPPKKKSTSNLIANNNVLILFHNLQEVIHITSPDDFSGFYFQSVNCNEWAVDGMFGCNECRLIPLIYN